MKAEKAIKLGKCSECKKALYSNEDIHYEGRRKYCVPCHAALIETRMNETVADRDRKLVAKTVALRQETAEERYLTEFEKWVWRYKKMTPHEQLMVAQDIQRSLDEVR